MKDFEDITPADIDDSINKLYKLFKPIAYMKAARKELNVLKSKVEAAEKQAEEVIAGTDKLLAERQESLDAINANKAEAKSIIDNAREKSALIIKNAEEDISLQRQKFAEQKKEHDQVISGKKEAAKKEDERIASLQKEAVVLEAKLEKMRAEEAKFLKKFGGG